jgi:hypothetical protein
LPRSGGKVPTMIPLATVVFLLAPAPAVPTIDVDAPTSGVYCTADYSYCWIERGACAESRPDSRAHLNGECD